LSSDGKMERHPERTKEGELMRRWIRNTRELYRLEKKRKLPLLDKILDYLWIPFRGFRDEKFTDQTIVLMKRMLETEEEDV
jgi:hypothetical protein